MHCGDVDPESKILWIENQKLLKILSSWTRREGQKIALPASPSARNSNFCLLGPFAFIFPASMILQWVPRTQILRSLLLRTKNNQRFQLLSQGSTIWRPPYHRKRTQTEEVWTCLPFIRSGQNYLARHSEREKKTRQTEKEIGRQQLMDRPGVRQVPEGCGERRKMEETGCEIICGGPTTFAVKG